MLLRSIQVGRSGKVGRLVRIVLRMNSSHFGAIGSDLRR